MTEPRELASLTVLEDGRVLIAGGRGERTPTPTAEIWDPATGEARAINSMRGARDDHAAVRLQDGRVLVAGGWTWMPVAEIFDPASESWTAYEDVYLGTTEAFGVLLEDGRALLVGGWPDDGDTNIIFVFDPQDESFRPAAALPGPVEIHDVLRVRSGDVLIYGWYAPPGARGMRATLFAYDPDDGARQLWAASGRSPLANEGGGGQQAELRTAASTTTKANPLTATELLDGSILLNRPGLLFDPETGTVEDVPSLNGWGGEFTHRLPDGRVLLSHWTYDMEPYDDYIELGLFDPAKREVQMIGRVPGVDTNRSEVMLQDGSVLFAGGKVDGTVPGSPEDRIRALYRYQPADPTALPATGTGGSAGAGGSTGRTALIAAGLAVLSAAVVAMGLRRRGV